MIRRNTWVLLVILAALVGFSIYLTNQKTKQAAQATPTTGSAVLFSSADGSPNDIKIADNIGNTVEIVKSDSGTWSVTSPINAAADQGSAEAAVTQLDALTVLANVQLGPDVVGLDKPSYVINISFAGGKTHKLTVGSVTPIQNGYYVQLDSLPVQIVDKQGLDAILGILNNPPYAATLTPAASATSTVLPETSTPEATIIPAATSVTGTP
jgi:hypothetical protein